MKRKVWILVQQLLPQRNSQSWEPNRKALTYEPSNVSVRLRGRCLLGGKLSVLSEPRYAKRIRTHCVDAETSSLSSVFIARGYLSSNVKNQHPFNHLPGPRLYPWPLLESVIDRWRNYVSVHLFNAARVIVKGSLVSTISLSSCPFLWSSCNGLRW